MPTVFIDREVAAWGGRGKELYIKGLLVVPFTLENSPWGVEPQKVHSRSFFTVLFRELNHKLSLSFFFVLVKNWYLLGGKKMQATPTKQDLGYRTS